MNDLDLAKAVVRSGVGRCVKHIGDRESRFFRHKDVADHLVQTRANEFVNDWDVAGEMMEGLTYRKLFNILDHNVYPHSAITARVIIERCATDEDRL